MTGRIVPLFAGALTLAGIAAAADQPERARADALVATARRATGPITSTAGSTNPIGRRRHHSGP
jgi:hypothetical protein